MSVLHDNLSCQSDHLAAYLDGELDEARCQVLEMHLKHCASCSAELAEQRLLLCTLDSTLGWDSNVSLPADFAQLVAARAECDMRGVRNRREHKLALGLCSGLALTAFTLLGFAAGREQLGIVSRLFVRATAVLDLGWAMIYDAVAGLTIVTRMLSKGFISGSALAGLIAFLLLCPAVLLLSRLITNYHRARLLE